MEEIAYAKINLALHIRGRRPDNYHSLETLFAFAEDGDRLTVGESSDLRLDVTGPFAADLSGVDNLVLRAAEALRKRFVIGRGAALQLDKRLPIASGIGGGSADAAAAFRLLARWWGVKASADELVELAVGLGADVPACIRSETALGTGRGDELAPVRESGLSGMPLLLVNPLVPLSTAEIFAAWGGVDRGPVATGPAIEAACAGGNDLEFAAIGKVPQIAEVLALLREVPGTILSRMSGSGATCFALFEDEPQRDRAAAAIASRHPGWWRLASRLR